MANSGSPEDVENKEWVYPGPKPGELLKIIKDEITALGEGGDNESKKVEAKVSLHAYSQSADTLLELAKLPEYSEAATSMPRIGEDEKLEHYLDRLTPLQQKIRLHQVQLHDARLLLMNSIA